MDYSSPSYHGQKIYTPALLNIYDLWVLGISNHLIWRCPTRKLLNLYNQHVSSNHLDIGVGTGYYLDHCKFPNDHPKIVLLDLNPNSIVTTSNRIQRYHPKSAEIDVLKPFSLPYGPFDSIGLQYLFHCLPGTLEEKEKVLRHLKPFLKPNGVIFGATILGQGVPQSIWAQKLMAFYNSKRVFSNAQDNLDSLHSILNRNFDQVSIHLEGCVALFSARGRKS